MPGSSIPIVGKSFTVEAFAAYVGGLQLDSWKPSFVVLHNTAEPTLADWHHVSGARRMAGLADFYGSVQKWHAGPHLFIADDLVWAFSDLRHPGVHSPSWNKVSWGVEMVGDFATEPFNSGAGANVRDNAVAALAILHIKAGLDSATMKIHKEDPLTTHDCPGKHVVKADFVKRLHDEIVRRRK